MKNRMTGIVCMVAFAVGLSVYADVVDFGDDVGGDIGGTGWAAQGVGDDANSTETASVLVAPEITLNLGINFSSDNVGLATTGELTEAGRNTWRNNGSKFTFTLSITDNSTTEDIESLELSSVTFISVNRAGEQVTFTESASANSVIMGHSPNPQTMLASTIYGTSGLSNPLTLDNVSTWDLIIENTGDNQITGIDAVSFAYTIPEPATLGLIAFAGGGILLIRRRIMM